MDNETTDFIRQRIEADLADNAHQGVITRFLSETQRIFAHWLRQEYSSELRCCPGIRRRKRKLRFDDTNPIMKATSSLNSSQRDVAWLGFQEGDDMRLTILSRFISMPKRRFAKVRPTSVP